MNPGGKSSAACGSTHRLFESRIVGVPFNTSFSRYNVLHTRNVLQIVLALLVRLEA